MNSTNDPLIGVGNNNLFDLDLDFMIDVGLSTEMDNILDEPLDYDLFSDPSEQNTIPIFEPIFNPELEVTSSTNSTPRKKKNPKTIPPSIPSTVQVTLPAVTVRHPKMKNVTFAEEEHAYGEHPSLEQSPPEVVCGSVMSTPFLQKMPQRKIVHPLIAGREILFFKACTGCTQD